MQINDMDEAKIKNTIRKMQRCLSLAFPDKGDLSIGFYALLTAQVLINRYFDEDCENEVEFKNIKCCLLNNLSEFTKTVFKTQFKKRVGK